MVKVQKSVQQIVLKKFVEMIKKLEFHIIIMYLIFDIIKKMYGEYKFDLNLEWYMPVG